MYHQKWIAKASISWIAIVITKALAWEAIRGEWPSVLKHCSKYCKVPSSNPIRHLAWLRDPTSLRGSQWPSAQKCKMQWLTSGEWGYPLDNGPKMDVGQPNSSLKKSNRFFVLSLHKAVMRFAERCFDTKIASKSFGHQRLRSQSFPHENHYKSVMKNSHQGCGLCCLHLPIFFSFIHSQLLQQNKKLLWAVFLSKLDPRRLICEDWFQYE